MRVKNSTQRFEVFVQDLQESFWGDFQGQTQQMLKQLLETDAEQQMAEYLGLKWQERAQPEERVDYRNGFYERDYVTPLGVIRLRIPRTRQRSSLPRWIGRLQRRAPPLANGRGGHVTLRQKIAAQAVANLAGVDAIVLLFCRRNGPQHQRMRHFQGNHMWQQVVVDPAREHGGFHRRGPRLRQCFDPTVQVKACGGNRSFGVNRATAVLHAVADRLLVNIQPDVIHRLYGGASLVSLNQRPLSSAFVHQALLL